MKFNDQNGQLMPMADILAKLEGKFGDLNSAAAGAKLTEAFGGEGARVITALSKDTDRFKSSLDKLGQVRGLEDAANMAKAMVDPWQQFAKAVEALRIAFGQALIPILAPLMDRLVGIAGTLTRWTQLFPNITRVVGITVLTILGLTAAMAAMTFLVGLSKMVWLSLVVVWQVLTWTGWKSIAMFLYHAVMVTAFVAGMILMVAWMGLVKGAMLLWQGAIWLVNAAMYANPVGLIIAGIVALVAIVGAAIYYWDDLSSALMNTVAFKWVSDQLSALSDWFGSMGGWSGMAKAAWDGIVAIFQKAINGLIEMLNKIPGVNIEASLGSMPEIPGASSAMSAGEQAERSQKVQQSINAAIPSLSPTRASAVPPGGLLTSIQNTSNQNKGNHVDKVEIHTAKPMSPLELENMMAMAVGG